MGTPFIMERSGVTVKSQLEVAPDVGPFTRQDAVHHDVPGGAVAACAVVANHAVTFRAQRLDRPLRPKIEVVRPQAHYLATERIEGVAEQQQLAGRVDVRALAALRVPRVPDLHAIDRGSDIVIAGRADDDAAREVPYRPGEHVTLALPLQRVGYVGPHPLGRGHGNEPQLPQVSIRRGAGQGFVVLGGERLETDAAPLEHDGLHGDHVEPAASPGAPQPTRRSTLTGARRCAAAPRTHPDPPDSAADCSRRSWGCRPRARGRSGTATPSLRCAGGTSRTGSRAAPCRCGATAAAAAPRA